MNVADYANAAAWGQLLKELDFPTYKDEIIRLVRRKVPISQNERRPIEYVRAEHERK